MDKTLLEQLKDAKVSNELAYVSFFNNGKVREDERLVNKRMDDFYLDDTIKDINYTFRDAAENYAKYTYDTITMNLEIGLIFKKEDVDKENHIKENAEPLKGIVRVYTGDINSYLDGKQTNEMPYIYGKQGFANYDKIVSTMRKNGIVFNGPEKFEDFKKEILSGKQFDISLLADLNDKENKETIKEEIQQEKTKRLVKIPFFKKNK